MRRAFTAFAAGILLFMFSDPAFAVNPDEVLSDPVLEQRARSLSVGIRCLVCQNQSIDDSDAELARDLRVLVREKLVEGLSDDEILDYLVARYGEFVLLKPRLGVRTIVLWSVPFLLLILGLLAIWRLFSVTKRKTAEAELLSEDEKSRIEKLLDNAN